jgi:hypothetical protein
MSMKLIAALDAYYESAKLLSQKWEEESDKADTTLNNNRYPFQTSFDDLVGDVKIWVDESKRQLGIDSTSPESKKYSMDTISFSTLQAHGFKYDSDDISGEPDDYRWVERAGIYYPVREAEKVKHTIDLTPSWSGIVSWMIAILTEGDHTKESVKIAKETLTKMAQVADLHVAWVKSPEYAEMKQKEPTAMLMAFKDKPSRKMADDMGEHVEPNTSHPVPKLFLSPNDTYLRAESMHGWNIATIEDQPGYDKATARRIVHTYNRYGECFRHLKAMYHAIEATEQVNVGTRDLKDAADFIKSENQK